MQNATTATPPKSLHGNDTMNNFYPALVQCFGIILCGYIAGRFKIISNAETKGMSTFVGTFALPSLIFLNLLELNWSTVNWSFLLAILVAKGVVFFVVLIVSLLVSRPLNYARAGLMAIFCTQSNDFAIGHPIVMALYKDFHPEYPSYLYLMAPISLAILNPIGLALMEIAKIVKNKEERTRNPPLVPETPQEQMSKWNRFFGERSILVFNIIVALFFNPLLLMTLLGVAGGFLFPHAIPECICSILRTLGKSFSATALFLLGMKIVGGAGSDNKSNGFLLPGVLILMKIVVLPLVIRQTVNLMESGHNANETTELSSFGFLYGAIPTAAVAFVVATRYNLEVESVARSLVFCTIISAPVMFISAKMISVKNLKVEDYLYELDAFSYDISVAGAVACCCMLMLLIVTKRFKRMPQRITFCLVLSQLMCCIGVILWSKMEHVHQWPLYFQFLLFNIGTYSTRLWTGLLAISLLFLQCRSLCFVLKMWPYMMVFSWGVPVITSVFLVIFDSNVMSGTKYNPSFQYGNVQAYISVLMLVICFIVTVVCLVIHQRYKKRFENYMPHSRPLANTDSVHSIISTTNLMGRTDHSSIRTTSYSSSSDDDEMIPTATGMVVTRASVSGSRASVTESDSGCGDRVDNPSTASTAVVDIEDQKNRKRQSSNATNSKDLDTIETASTNDDGPSTSHQIEHFEDQNRSGLEQITDFDEHQTLKHTVLLIILLGSIFVELAVFVWTLVMEKMSGIYWELSFLDVFLNFGQGLIVLAVFITDVGELLMPVVRFWRKLWYGTDGVSLPHCSNLKPETLHICDQFRNHHLENCKKDIAKDRRWRFQAYCQVFYGSEFVSWLIEVGLSKDRLEAVHYARHLVDGRVLRHINNVYHFEDKLLLYNFCSRN